MDCRVTLNKNETFIDLLVSLFESKSKVDLLLDDNGFVRAEGFINVIHTDVAAPFIELNNGVKIPIATIVAVNGWFLPDYAEC